MDSSTQNSGDLKGQVLIATNIVDLVSRTVALKKRGKNYVGLCPFHNEKSPSFHVDSVKQFFKCFGCGAGGNAIDFVMKRDRMEFIDAMKLLAEQAGIEVVQNGQGKERSGQRKLLLEAQSAACFYFEKQLASPAGEAVRQYIQNRGINAESLKRFQMGLAVDSWDSLLKSPAVKKFPPELLASAGLVKPRERDGRIDGHYDTFRNRLMFPIRDENARVIAFGGRTMPGSQDPAKYLNSPETPLFSKSRCIFGLDLARQRIAEKKVVAVVEGYTDVVMAHQFGVSNVVSILGTAMTEQHVAILRRFADKVVLLFDPDAAGENAVNRVVELFLTQPVEIGIASLPEELDPDEFLLKYGAEAFEAVLSQSTDALTFKWKQLSQRFNQRGKDLTGQQKAVQEYLDLLASARGAGPVDPLRWGAALTRVSRLTDIPAEELNRRFKLKRPRPAARVAPEAGTSSEGQSDSPAATIVPENRFPTARDFAERWILAVLLMEPHRWNGVQDKILVEDFLEPRRRRIAEVYWNHQRDEGEPVLNEFLSLLPEPGLSQLVLGLAEEYQALGDAATRLQEALSLIAEQRERADRQKLMADLRRSSSGPVSDGSPEMAAAAVVASDMEDQLLRKLQEKARRPDLRKAGS